MKKVKLEKKLNLNKKTITNLKSGEMKEVKGGGTKHTCVLSICIFCYNTHEYFTCGC